MGHDFKRTRVLRRGSKAGFVLYLGWVVAAHAQTPGLSDDGGNGVSWEVRAEPLAGGRGDRSELVFSARIAPGWILYSSDFRSELGPRPARFTVDPSSPVALIGAVQAIKPLHRDDKTFGARYTYFEKQGEFRQRVQVKDHPAVVTGQIEGQACHEADGTCTLIHKQFSIRLE